MKHLDQFGNLLARIERRADHVRATPTAALAATLDINASEPVSGADLPPLWHWLYFAPLTATRDIAEDGRSDGDGLLPPSYLRQRHHAGGRLWFHHALRIDDEITRASRVVDMRTTTTQSGPCVAFTVRHEITNALGVAVIEEQDIVCYEGRVAPARPGCALPELAPCMPGRRVSVSPLLLFRYSALTFNGHRIHYDRAYATGTEGYPGLVVPTTLLSLLLLEELRRQQPGLTVRSFKFTALRPLFDTHPVELRVRTESARGGQCHSSLWACNHVGQVAMQAHADLIASA